MTTSRAASGQHARRARGSTVRAHHTGDLERPDLGDRGDFADGVGGDFEKFSDARVLVAMPYFVRQRIRLATEQTHRIIIERLRHAKRPQDAASEAGMVDEVRALAQSRKTGSPSDIRCMRLALAATLILLAEMDDRPAAPPRGQRRAGAQRQRPPSFTIPAA